MDDAAAQCERLYEEYGAMAYAFARRLVGCESDAIDAVQAALITIWENGLREREGASERAWFLGVVHNHVRVLRRGHARRRRREDTYMRRDVQATPRPDESLQRQEQLELVQQCLAGLRERDQTVIHLHHIEGLTQREIAEIMGVKQGTVAAWIHRAGKRLRERLLRAGAPATLGLLGLLRSLEAHPVPSGLHHSVEQLVREGPSGLSGAGAAAGGTAATTAGIWWGALGMVGLIASAVWWAGQSEPDGLQIKKEAQAALHPDPQAAAGPGVQRLAAQPVRWDGRDWVAYLDPDDRVLWAGEGPGSGGGHLDVQGQPIGVRLHDWLHGSDSGELRLVVISESVGAAHTVAVPQRSGGSPWPSEADSAAVLRLQCVRRGAEWHVLPIGDQAPSFAGTFMGDDVIIGAREAMQIIACTWIATGSRSEATVQEGSRR